MGDSPTTNREWIELDKQYRLQSRHTRPIVLERGNGIYLWDVEGKRYVDFESGQSCALLGHCHPEYVEAVNTQAQTFMQSGTAYTVPAQALLAQKLAEISPPALRKSYFDCSGSHINEVAIRLAKFVTGRFEMVALLHGYHGSTQGTQHLTGHGRHTRNRYGPAHPNITFIPVPYSYRCPEHETPQECAAWCLRFAEEILDWATTGRPAGLIMEPILGAGGVIVPPIEWHQGLRRICEERGMIQIFDECHTGLGRTGRWFAFEHFDVVPDIVTIGKGLGELPISAAIVSDEVAQAAEELGFSQSASHSGDPILCVGGLTAIRIMEERNLISHSATVGAHIEQRLQALAEAFEIIGDVRGRGLMLGVEIVHDGVTKEPGTEIAEAIVEQCMHKGLLLFYRPGSRYSIEPGHIIRFSPPLVITIEEADEAMSIFEEVVESVSRRLPERSTQQSVSGAAEMLGVK